MELVCIKCPRGCNLVVNDNDVSGNLCPRGIEYAREEMTCPMRMVTSLIKTYDGLIVPVKTSVQIPKSKIDSVLLEISKLKVDRVDIGDIILHNVAGTNANIVVTGEPYLH